MFHFIFMIMGGKGRILLGGWLVGWLTGRVVIFQLGANRFRLVGRELLIFLGGNWDDLDGSEDDSANKKHRFFDGF